MVGCELRSRHFPLSDRPDSVIQSGHGATTTKHYSRMKCAMVGHTAHLHASSTSRSAKTGIWEGGPDAHVPSVGPTRSRWIDAAVFVTLAAISTSLVCATAARRPLWYDELMTLHMVSAPDVASFWRMLVGGTDLNPPLHHLTVRAVTSFLGYGPLALRVPSIAGFGLMAVCLYAIMRRHVGRAAACVALLFPFTTRAYWYAFEARPYGLMMGFCALAFFCWQSAAADRRRTLALVGLMLSLAAAISTHFYTVFVFLALASGELARTLSRRRLDLAVWAAFGVGALPLGLFGPVIASARSRSTDFWSRPSMTKCFDFYSWLISTEAIFPLLVLGLVSICLATLTRPTQAQPGETGDKSSRKMPIHECVALVAFTLIPVFTHVVALTVTNAFVERYALTAVIGLSAMTSLFLDWRPRGKMAALVPAVVFLFWVAFVQVIVCRRVTSERDAYALLSRELAHADGEQLPIVVADARDYLQLRYKAAEPLAGRLMFARGVPGSPAEASSAGEIERLGRWVPLVIDDLAALEKAHPRFLVYGRCDSGLVTSLADPGSGAVVTARGPELYLVQGPRQDISTVRLQHNETPVAE